MKQYSITMFLFFLISNLVLPLCPMTKELTTLTRQLYNLQKNLTTQTPRLTSDIKKVAIDQQETFETIKDISSTDFLAFGGATLVNELLEAIQNTLPVLTIFPKKQAESYAAMSSSQLEWMQKNRLAQLSEPQRKDIRQLLIDLKTYIVSTPTISSQWLIFPANQTISPTTNHYIQEVVPFTLPSGNQIGQLTTLSQFLRINDITNIYEPHEYQPETGIYMQKYIQLLKTVPKNNELFTHLKDAEEFLLLGGGPASCGYHAVKNALMILRSIHAPSQNEALQTMLDIHFATEKFAINAEYMDILDTFKHGEWRQYVISNYEAYLEDKSGDWLTEYPVQALFNHLLSQEPGNWKNNIEITTYAYGKTKKEIFDEPVIEKLKKQDNAIHVFLIGTMTLSGGPGHWFTMVVNVRNKNRQYIIADSANTPRYSSDKLTPEGKRQNIQSGALHFIIEALEA